MHIIKFVRTISACQEEYGRVEFDGKKIHFEGLTDIFQKYLEKGILGPDYKTYKPSDGIKFLNKLKRHLDRDVLMAVNVVEE